MAMFILTVHWDLRALRAVMTVTARAYLVCLLVGAAYSTYSLARIGWRFRQSPKHAPSTDVNELRLRLQTLAQFHMLLLLLFGVCCSNEAFAALRAFRYSSMSLSGATIEVFEPVAAFAFVVFLVLLLLHALKWTVAHRLQRFAEVREPAFSF
jgi:hypothetical protein